MNTRPTRLTWFSKTILLLLLSIPIFALIGEVTLAGTILGIVLKIIISIVAAGIVYGFVTATLKRL